MHKNTHPHTSEPPRYPLSGRLAKIPTFVMIQLMRTNLAYRAAVRAKLPPEAIDADADLRFPHYAALEILQEHGPMSQKELSQRLRFDASDLVTIVDELEARGLVSRTRDEHDRRRYQLTVTSTAQAKIDERFTDVNLMTEMFFAPLSTSELRIFRAMLLKLDKYHSEHFEENAQALADRLSNIKK